MTQESAGLLLCRVKAGTPEFLIVHPGGPYFASKDDGAWTIPKGLIDDGESPLDAALREFAEETGFSCASDHYESLGQVRLKSRKIVHGFAFVGDCDPSALKSNAFEIEWPPRSGRRRSYPEVDRAQFFGADAARRKLIEAQAAFIDRALAWLARSAP
jgi:predicted NUDIX family NTP pyrophosphohydrolase